MVTQGSAYVSIDGETRVLCNKDVAFVRSGQMHMATAVDNEDFKYRAVVFKPDLLCSFYDDIVQTEYIRPIMEGYLQPLTFVIGGDRVADATRIFISLFDLLWMTPKNYELLIKARLFELTAELVGESIRKKPHDMDQYDCGIKRMKLIISHISERYNEHITVSQLSEMANMSIGHFTREFKRFTTMAPIDYLIKVRMRKASELLVKTDEKLIQIAIDTGFFNVSYFIRAFKHHYGCSPTNYRKRYRIEKF